MLRSSSVARQLYSDELKLLLASVLQAASSRGQSDPHEKHARADRRALRAIYANQWPKPRRRRAAGAAFGLMHGKWPATSELAGVTAEPHAIDAKKKYT